MHNYYSLYKWKQHHRKRKRFISNFPAEKQPLLEQVIGETNLPTFIHDVATDAHGRIIPGDISVWLEGDESLALFWKAYERLAAKEVGK